jgi:hypothetical protein
LTVRLRLPETETVPHAAVESSREGDSLGTALQLVQHGRRVLRQPQAGAGAAEVAADLASVPVARTEVDLAVARAAVAVLVPVADRGDLQERRTTAQPRDVRNARYCSTPWQITRS